MSVFIPSQAFVRVGDKFCPYFTEVDPALKAGPTLVYEKLFRLAYETGVCWPSQEYLALICKITVKSVQTYLRKLIALDYISIEQRDGHNVYTLVFSSRVRELLARANVNVYAPPVSPSSLPQSEHAKTVRSGGENFSPYLRAKRKQESPLPPLPVQRPEDTHSLAAPALEGRGGSCSARLENQPTQNVSPCTTNFERLWNAWPQSASWPMQRDRERALRVFASKSRQGVLPPITILLESVERFKATDSRWQNGYPPELANWLYADGWKQEPVQRQVEKRKSAFPLCGREIPHVSPHIAPELQTQVQAVTTHCQDKALSEASASPVLQELHEAVNTFCTLWPDTPRQLLMTSLFLERQRGTAIQNMVVQATRYRQEMHCPLPIMEWLTTRAFALQ